MSGHGPPLRKISMRSWNCAWMSPQIMTGAGTLWTLDSSLSTSRACGSEAIRAASQIDQCEGLRQSKSCNGKETSETARKRSGGRGLRAAGHEPTLSQSDSTSLSVRGLQSISSAIHRSSVTGSMAESWAPRKPARSGDQAAANKARWQSASCVRKG